MSTEATMNISSVVFLCCYSGWSVGKSVDAFVPSSLSKGHHSICSHNRHQHLSIRSLTLLAAASDDDDSTDSRQEDEADRLKSQAEALREQIRKMEKDLPDDRRRPTSPPTSPIDSTPVASKVPASLLDNQRVLVVGANGRLGSMVCRYLLRQHPEIKEMVACVHVVGENSETSRGYGRLSYEVGAEDGIGSIGPAWSEADERMASFEFDVETMTDYNLQKLRVVECELLDPVQCNSIVEDSKADVVVWCATDFNGNQPRAVSGLNIAFLFRAVTDPTKGRVEVEGLQNMLGAIKTTRQEEMQRNRMMGYDNNSSAGSTATETPTATKPVDILLASIAPDALADFETPFGTFLDQKKQGEDMIPKDFPSLSYTTLQVCACSFFTARSFGKAYSSRFLHCPVLFPLQFARYEDNFVDEGLDLNFAPDDSPEDKGKRGIRRINRRDAARAVAAALVNPDFQGKKVTVWTNELKR
ncbi:MAG: hypothetical protein SGILL_002256 [Bacillariaceae sp.]